MKCLTCQPRLKGPKVEDKLNKQTGTLRAEYRENSWFFLDKSHPNNKIRFEQAIMDVVLLGEGYVEGHIKSVYGVDADIVQFLDNTSRRLLGVTGIPNLQMRNLKRFRLLPDGSVERLMEGQ